MVSALCAPATATITIHGVNDKPTVTPDTVIVDKTTTIYSTDATNVIVKDTRDPDDLPSNLHVTAVVFNGKAGVVGQALHGTYGDLTLNADGSYKYDPKTGGHMGKFDSVEDQFTYTVDDGHSGAGKQLDANV